MAKIHLSIRDSNLSILFAFALCLSSCLNTSNNDIIDKILEKEFLSKIKQDNAMYSDYQQDVLTPQKSFFINNKLKYLTFRHGPEVGFVQGRVIFDLTTDSIEKYTLRQVLPNKTEKVYDTLFVFFPKQHHAEIYYGNKLIDTIYRQDIFIEQLKFIDELKSGAQIKFSSKQQ